MDFLKEIGSSQRGLSQGWDRVSAASVVYTWIMDFLRDIGSGQRGLSQAGIESQQPHSIHGDYGAKDSIWPTGHAIHRGFLCWLVTSFGRHRDKFMDAEVAQRSKIGVKKGLYPDGR